jgi:acyl-coenzyme A synthetase/AMP-(fatty) acid ligase
VPGPGDADSAALVAAQPDADLSAELRGFCRERLAGFKVPKAIEFAPELPRTVSGKLLRRQLMSHQPPL